MFCLPVVLVGEYLIYCGRVAAFLVGLLFSFVNEPVEMLYFPPSIFGSRFWLNLQQHFVIHVLAS